MKISKLLTATACGLLLSSQSQAFTQNTHKQIAIDAVSYMQANPGTTNFNKLQAAANAAGYSVDEMAQLLGQGAFDVDDFRDTYLCGAITGDCVQAPVFGIGSFVATYTAWWHFQNHSHGGDAHGNDIGGYNNDLIPVRSAIDDGLRAWLINDHLDDGNKGMTGFCLFGKCMENSRYNSYDITEANYRLDTQSNKGMYDDFQSAPFQPIDNLSQYWYQQFLASPSFQTLGFALHATDLLQPHHVWVTTGNNHSGWEGWVNDYYEQEGLATPELVAQALQTFTALDPNSQDIRPILTEGGAFAYQVGGAVLHSKDHAMRVQVGKQVVPHAIAMVVHILNHAAEQLEAEAVLQYKDLRNGRSGLCLDIKGANASVNTPVMSWTCNSGSNQKWAYQASSGLLISQQNPSLCASLAANPANGQTLRLQDCQQATRWSFSQGIIRSQTNQQQALDAYGSNAGSEVGTWSFHGGSNQTWYFGQ